MPNLGIVLKQRFYSIGQAMDLSET